LAIRIVADEREKNSRVPNLLKLSGVFVDYKQLAVGDYIVSSETVIERKTIYDLINSVYDGRIFIQCSDLINYYAKPLIIIEGNLTDLDTREHFENDSKLIIDKIRVAYETLIKVALDFRIPILYTNSVFYTAELLVLLASNQFRSKNDGPLLKKIKKSNPFLLQQLYVLTSLPGIGSKLATRLLAELARVPGLGNMRAEKIRKILDTPVPKVVDIYTQKKLMIDNTDENTGDDSRENNIT